VAGLLDVNSLIALLDPDHVHHEAMHRWFAMHAKQGWATCPITENGFVRVVSQPAYPSGQRQPQEAIYTLGRLKSVRRESHEFWADEISLTDQTVFRAEYLVRSGQITDAYLLGLAAKHGGTLLSFDQSLPWQAIQAATSALIQRPI
jgi:toxin-antitoxin system PIN domain toxin